MQDNVLANPWQSEKKYPVDISNTELSPLACRGSKGQTPMASLGTAQRLAPVQSGLPLCETCPVISPPLNRHPPSHIFHPTLSDQNGDDSGLVVQELTVEEKEKLPFHRFSLSETGCSCITPIRSIGQSYAVSGTLFFSSPCLFNPPICQRFSVIFSCYFCLSFSTSLSISAKRHKNSSHKHFSNS